MKHLVLSLFTLHFSLLTLSAAVPLRWTVETSGANPATFDQFAGATYDLEAALQSRGKPLAVSGDPRLYWQTNGMGSAWWSAPASASGNVLRATWTPSCDVGARAYSCFIGVTGSVFNAAFQLRLRPSPGATPNELPLPVPTIDFSKVTVINPPWSNVRTDTNAVERIAVRAAETNAVVVSATNTISSHASQLSQLSRDKRDKDDLDVYSGTNVVDRIATTNGVQNAIETHHDDTKVSKSGTTTMEQGAQIEFQDGGISLGAGSLHGENADAHFMFLEVGGINFNDKADEETGTDRQVVRGSYDGLDGSWNIKVIQALTAVDLIGFVSWDKVIEHPITLEGYGITDGATKEELAAKRDLTDNKCRKTEFTEWTNDVDARYNPRYVQAGGVTAWFIHDGDTLIANQAPNYSDPGATELHWGPSAWDRMVDITFTRSAVCTSNETFATRSYVTNAVNAAKYVPSATDPTFSNAVLAVQIDTNTVAQIGKLKQFFDGIPTGTAATSLGGIILALLGAAAYLKKKTALIETDGKASDTFATDLLGKQVAKDAVNDLIEDKIEDSTTSTSTTDALSANMGKELQDQIQNLKQRGRYLSIWNCTTGLAETEPTVNPYPYKAGDYFIVGTVGATNYRPNGAQYDKNTASTTQETSTVLTNDTYYYDGTSWSLLHTPMPPVPTEYLKSATATDNSLTVTKQDNTQVSLTVNYEYAVGAFGSSIASGEIRTIAPITLTVPVTLNLGNSATESADCALWVDTSNLASDVTLSLSSNYNYFGDTGYQTMTKGKHILVTFLRLNATDVIVTKKEY